MGKVSHGLLLATFQSIRVRVWENGVHGRPFTLMNKGNGAQTCPSMQRCEAHAGWFLRNLQRKWSFHANINANPHRDIISVGKCTDACGQKNQ